MLLYDYKSSSDTPVYVVSLAGSDFSGVTVQCADNGLCQIKSISLKENIVWRFSFLFAEFLILSLICLNRYVFKFLPKNTKIKYFLVTVFIIFCSLPSFCGKTYCLTGDDFNFHFGRIAAIAGELKYGHFPAVYQSDALNGFGYISLLTYGNLFLYIPALLHLAGLPLPACYNIFIIIVNAAACLIALYSFRRIFKNEKTAYLATIIYILAPYRLCDTYYRAALGESLAMTFLPLVVYGFYKIYFACENVKFKTTIPLIIGISGIIQSHILSLEMLIPFVVIFALINFKKTIKNIGYLTAALFTILLLNAYFLITFITSIKGLLVTSFERSFDIFSMTATVPQIFSIFIPLQNSSDFLRSMPLCIGLPLTIGIMIFVILCINKNNDEPPKIDIAAVECFAFGMISLFLASPYFPWAALAGRKSFLIRTFTSIQFPYRFLEYATLFLVPVTAYSIEKTAEIYKITYEKLFIIVAIICIVTGGDFFTKYVSGAEKSYVTSCTANQYADNMYYPKDLNYDLMFYDTAIYCEPATTAVMKMGTDGNNNRLFYADNVIVDSTAILPIAYYDFLTAFSPADNSYFETFPATGGRLAVKLPAGFSGTIVISYKMKNIWKAGLVISFISAALLMISAILNMWKSKNPSYNLKDMEIKKSF